MATRDSGSAVELVITPRERDIGGGAMVQRILPYVKRRTVGPFTFLDAFGPVTVAAGAGADVLPHPHVHLATVTYLFEGETLHRDSVGTVATIKPGDMGWMNAGRGIVHSERTPPELRMAARRSHGLQAWVALPDEAEDSEPSFQHLSADAIPQRVDDGLRLRVLAGQAFGLHSPIEVFSSLFYVEVTAERAGGLTLPANLGERAVFVVSGDAKLDGASMPSRSLSVLRDGTTPQLNLTAGSTVMLLGGQPLGRRYMYWNFVASSPERLEAAKARWRALDFPLIPDDQDEHVPLPE